MSVDIDVGHYGANHALGDLDLQGPALYVLKGSADQAIQVGLVNGVRIDQHVVPDADVGELLDDMRPASSQADDADLGALQVLFARGAQEALTVMFAHRDLRTSEPSGPPA